jgi:hypothetical protein
MIDEIAAFAKRQQEERDRFIRMKVNRRLRELLNIAQAKLRHRVRPRFPELVEFCDIVVALGDELGEPPYDIEPTIPPKQLDKT